MRDAADCFECFLFVQPDDCLDRSCPIDPHQPSASGSFVPPSHIPPSIPANLPTPPIFLTAGLLANLLALYQITALLYIPDKSSHHD